jgi:hypothetical protein
MVSDTLLYPVVWRFRQVQSGNETNDMNDQPEWTAA